MTSETSSDMSYEIRIRGHLDPCWEEVLEATRLTHQPDGTTCLLTAPIDQARLHGIIARLRDGGVTLLLIRAGGEWKAADAPG